MSDNRAKRDLNYIPVAQGVTDDANLTPSDLLVDPTTRRLKVDSLISGYPNASYVLAYTDGDLTKITKTIGGVSYEKTFTYTDDEITGISAWSEV